MHTIGRDLDVSIVDGERKACGILLSCDEGVAQTDGSPRHSHRPDIASNSGAESVERPSASGVRERIECMRKGNGEQAEQENFRAVHLVLSLARFCGYEKEMSSPSLWCVGRNFDEHAHELGNPVSRGEPLIFLKPMSSAQYSPSEFVLPVVSQDVQPEVEVVFRCSRAIHGPLTLEQAWDAVDAWAVGLDWTARDLQAVAKKNGHPWVRAKGFRGAASLGPWQAIAAGQAREVWSGLEFGLELEGKKQQSARLATAVFTIAEILVFLSQWADLAAGDLIFTGTPAGVRSVGAQMQVHAWAELQWASGSMRSAISLSTRSD